MVTNYWSDYNGLPKSIEDRAFIPAYYTTAGSGIDHVHQSSSSAQRQTINLTSNYALKIADSHNFNFMLGIQSVSYKYTDHWSKKMALMDYENPQSTSLQAHRLPEVIMRGTQRLVFSDELTIT